ncbi:hypothetical protein [Kangiella sp. TOML190]|uniref:hypothetical protein n=1 Tax=Kangiella sp. TOML190 TaxID=2931351 RepID=UPI00203C28A2|nr:hypothetical protein [Kangiella sp. TOML190]
MKFIVTIFFLTITLSISAERDKTPTEPPPFLTNKQKIEFFEKMIYEIERLDAEIIETRNHAKEVKWDQFKQHYRKLFEEASNWDQLSRRFYHFSQGLVNLHTRTKFLAFEPENTSKNDWLNDKVLFEYPAKRFYLESDKSEITYLNKTPILDAFQKFSNYRCRHNNEAGCIDMFSVYLQAGAIKPNGEEISKFRTLTADGNVQTVIAQFNAEPTADPDPFTDNYCESHQGYTGFELVFKGQNACLYKKQDTAVLRLRNFNYQDKTESDIYCQKQEGDFCKDINGLLEQLHLHKPNHLIFDMSHNFGGNENTKFLAAFMPNNFQDLPVMYRNTKEIHDQDIRINLFWGNADGEKWFQQVKGYQGEFFPIRGDFCRGKNGCHLSLIKPNPNAYVADKISIISDWMCVSSCDDFVWRMMQFAGAKLYGIAPAQDATYARARVLLYLNKTGEISTKVSAETHSFYLDDIDYSLAELKIPYSKTVTLNGELRNIQTPTLTQVPLTIKNYSNYPQAVLDTIMQQVGWGEE